jgi:hypothetical protein
MTEKSWCNLVTNPKNKVVSMYVFTHGTVRSESRFLTPAKQIELLTVKGGVGAGVKVYRQLLT